MVNFMHLFVVDAHAVPDLPRDGRPHILVSDGWSTAGWLVGTRLTCSPARGAKQMLQSYVRDSQLPSSFLLLLGFLRPQTPW